MPVTTRKLIVANISGAGKKAPTNLRYDPTKKQIVNIKCDCIVEPEVNETPNVISVIYRPNAYIPCQFPNSVGRQTMSFDIVVTFTNNITSCINDAFGPATTIVGNIATFSLPVGTRCTDIDRDESLPITFLVDGIYTFNRVYVILRNT